MVTDMQAITHGVATQEGRATLQDYVYGNESELL